MKTKPLLDFLEDFDAGEPLPGSLSVAALTPRVANLNGSIDGQAERLQREYERGLEAGRAEGRRISADQIGSIESAARRELEAAKAEFSMAVARMIGEDLEAQLRALHDTLVSQIHAALLPIMRHVMTEAGIREFAQEMHSIALDAEATAVALSGPKELVDRVWQACIDLCGPDERKPTIRLEYKPQMEVRMTVDQQVIETRIMHWIGKLGEATV